MTLFHLFYGSNGSNYNELPAAVSQIHPKNIFPIVSQVWQRCGHTEDARHMNVMQPTNKPINFFKKRTIDFYGPMIKW